MNGPKSGWAEVSGNNRQSEKPSIQFVKVGAVMRFLDNFIVVSRFFIAIRCN